MKQSALGLPAISNYPSMGRRRNTKTVKFDETHGSLVSLRKRLARFGIATDTPGLTGAQRYTELYGRLCHFLEKDPNLARKTINTISASRAARRTLVRDVQRKTQRSTRFLKVQQEYKNDLIRLDFHYVLCHIRAGVHPDTEVVPGSTALLRLIFCQQPSLVKRCIELGADVNFEASTGMTPIMMAIIVGSTTILSMLLKNGAQINVCNQHGNSPLHIAAQYGRSKMLQLLLSDPNADVNVKHSVFGTTPIMTAVQSHQDHCVPIFLNAGASLTVQSATGDTVVSLAQQVNRNQLAHRFENHIQGGPTGEEACKMILEQFWSSRVNVMERMDRYIVTNSFDDMLSVIRKKEASPDQEGLSGFTPMLRACLYGKYDVVEELIRLGANPGNTNREGTSGLHLAAYFGHTEVAEILLNQHNRVSTEQQDSFGRTPLMLAASKGNLQIVKLLLAANADMEVTDQVGSNAFDFAALNGHYHIAGLLGESNEHYRGTLQVQTQLAIQDNGETATHQQGRMSTKDSATTVLSSPVSRLTQHIVRAHLTVDKMLKPLNESTGKIQTLLSRATESDAKKEKRRSRRARRKLQKREQEEELIAAGAVPDSSSDESSDSDLEVDVGYQLDLEEIYHNRWENSLARQQHDEQRNMLPLLQQQPGNQARFTTVDTQCGGRTLQAQIRLCSTCNYLQGDLHCNICQSEYCKRCWITKHKVPWKAHHVAVSIPVRQLVSIQGETCANTEVHMNDSSLTFSTLQASQILQKRLEIVKHCENVVPSPAMESNLTFAEMKEEEVVGDTKEQNASSERNATVDNNIRKEDKERKTMVTTDQELASAAKTPKEADLFASVANSNGTISYKQSATEETNKDHCITKQHNLTISNNDRNAKDKHSAIDKDDPSTKQHNLTINDNDRNAKDKLSAIDKDDPSTKQHNLTINDNDRNAKDKLSAIDKDGPSTKQYNLTINNNDKNMKGQYSVLHKGDSNTKRKTPKPTESDTSGSIKTEDETGIDELNEVEQFLHRTTQLENKKTYIARVQKAKREKNRVLEAKVSRANKRYTNLDMPVHAKFFTKRDLAMFINPPEVGLASIMLQTNQKLDEAADMLQRILGSQITNLGKSHPSVLETITLQAKVERKRGQLELAVQYGKQAMELAASLQGVDGGSAQNTISFLHSTMLQAGRFDELVTLWGQVLVAREESLGSEHVLCGKARHTIHKVKVEKLLRKVEAAKKLENLQREGWRIRCTSMETLVEMINDTQHGGKELLIKYASQQHTLVHVEYAAAVEKLKKLDWSLQETRALLRTLREKYLRSNALRTLVNPVKLAATQAKAAAQTLDLYVDVQEEVLFFLHRTTFHKLVRDREFEQHGGFRYLVQRYFKSTIGATHALHQIQRFVREYVLVRKAKTKTNTITSTFRIARTAVSIKR